MLLSRWNKRLFASIAATVVLAACGAESGEKSQKFDDDAAIPSCGEKMESSCDDQDDDRDGTVDDGCPCEFNDLASGVCANSTIDCQGACNRPAGYEEDESSCDGLDNDCDGSVDEDCDCETGNSRSCYSGPEETEGVGRCMSGTQVCTDGTWDECLNSILPRDELCDGIDDDCDGEVDEDRTAKCPKQEGVCEGATVECTEGEYPTCGPAHYGDDFEAKEATCDGLDNDCDGTTDPWRAGCEPYRLIGSSGDDSLGDVAVASDGSVYVAGSTDQGLMGQSYNGGAQDGLLAKYEPGGELSWIRLIGSPKHDGTGFVDVGPSGDVYVGGQTGGSIGGNSYNGGRRDALIARYRPDGTRVWVELLGTQNQEQVRHLASDPAGGIYVAGRINGPIAGQSYGGDPHDGYIARFESDGSMDWIRLFGPSGWQSARGIKSDGNGNVYAAGKTETALDGENYSGGDFDGFVRKYDSSGNHQWTRLVGTNGHDETRRIVLDAAGDLFVAGFSDKPFDSSMPSNTEFDGFIAHYAPNGTRQNVSALGTTGDDRFLDAGIDSEGTIYLAGKTDGGFGYKGGKFDAVVASMTRDGVRRVNWIGSDGWDEFRGIAVDHFDAVFGAGKVSGSIGGQNYSGGAFDGLVGVVN